MNEVEEVKNKTDIVSVIGEHVKLTKAGRHFRGLCPFHEERTPSFMVSPELQIYKCFGCGESGDVFTFLEKYEGMDFYEALKYLADKSGVRLAPRNRSEVSLKTQILEANALAAKFYHYLLVQHKLGRDGAFYIKNKRGLGDKTIERFQVGYAPPDRTLLFDFLTRKKNLDVNVLEQSGLVFKTGRGYMDRFRERIIFPISDARGQVIALAGRILPQFDTGRVGKYINSPETPVYHKSSSLYGLDITKDVIRKTKTAVVVEGELDLLSMWQAGIKNVVAIKGTAMTEEHINILSRFAQCLVLALDSDFAGDNASLRGLSFAQNKGLEIKVVNLSKYKDPDEFARSDPKGLLDAVKGAGDAWEFVIGVVSKRYDLSSGAGKASASRDLMPVIALIEDSIVRAHYMQKVANKFGVPLEAVRNEADKKQKKVTPNKTVAAGEVGGKSRRELLEEWLLAMLSLRGSFDSSFERYFENPKISRIFKLMYEYSANGQIFVFSEFAKTLPEELRGGYSDILMQDYGGEVKDVSREIEKTVREIKEITIREQLSKMVKKIADFEEQGNIRELDKLKAQFGILSRELTAILSTEG